MKKSVLMISVLLAVQWKSFAQGQFNFGIANLDSAVVCETKIGSIFTDTTEIKILKNPADTTSESIQAAALVFTRKNDGFSLQPHVWYYSIPNSKEIVAIGYTWSLYNPSFNANKNRELLEKLVKEESQFEKKYNSIKEVIISSYGKPYKDSVLIDKRHLLMKSTLWKWNEMIIVFKMEFSRVLQEFPGLGLQTNNFEITAEATKVDN